MIGLTVARVLTGMLALGPGTPAGVPAPSAPLVQQQAAGEIDFGDDAGTWANDGECDDKRFRGPGMTATVLLGDDIGHDASDCRAAWAAGQLELFQPVSGDLVIDGISFGDDSGGWTNDNQCDDPRFAGEAMSSILDPEDRLSDATDCAAAWQAGTIQLRDDDGDTNADPADITEAVTEDGVEFGTDSGSWTHDGECDDPRFTGAGMAGPPLLEEDIQADASDCLAAWRAGTITLAGGAQAPDKADKGGAPSISNRPGDRGRQ